LLALLEGKNVHGPECRSFGVRSRATEGRLLQPAFPDRKVGYPEKALDSSICGVPRRVDQGVEQCATGILGVIPIVRRKGLEVRPLVVLERMYVLEGQQYELLEAGGGDGCRRA